MSGARLRLALPPLVALAVVGLYAGWTWTRARTSLGVSRGQASAALAPGPVRFLKGQLHLHTDNSGDGHATPSEVVRWYERRGYDFIVFTDHNFVTVEPGTGALLTVPGVELTMNPPRCEPPGGGCNLHVNALFVDASRVKAAPPASGSVRRLDIYSAELEQAAALGALAQVTHPNFHYAADAELLTELARRGARLLEVANESSDSANDGDAAHPSTEALWDAVLSSGQTLWGVATDDAHDYDGAAERRAKGEEVYPGDLGFVMVRASKEPGAIRAALERGDFYASTGLLLASLEAGAGVLSLAVAGEEPCEVAFIGEGGRVLARGPGPGARFELAGAGSSYVRAVVTDTRGRKAWTQPLRAYGDSGG